MTSESRWEAGNLSQQHYDRSADNRGFPRDPALEMDKRTSAHPYQDHYEQRDSFHRRRDDRFSSDQFLAATASQTYGSTYLSVSALRHTSPGGVLTATSPSNQSYTGPWPSLPQDHRAQQEQITPAPLTLHIPDGQDLPRITTDLHGLRTGTVSRQQTTTSLPSFASFREHAAREDSGEIEIAPMSARIPCNSCSKLQPMIQNAVALVQDIGEALQDQNRGFAKPREASPDGLERAMQWIINQLSRTKLELQAQAQLNPQLVTPYSGVPSRTAPSPSLLKRPAWEHEELPEAKRRQSLISADDPFRKFARSISTDEQRASIDFATRSPHLAESIPDSTYPRAASPTYSSRQHQSLLSPTSMAFPSTAPQTVAPEQSPTNSYHPTVSIHTASTSSAASTHISNLQHQVTLKSLALQSLQSEYSSLLQKLQREKIKTQAIEKKTTVADQEVNDLTGRTEELSEQLKSLEAQLEASEKKREDERAQAVREKDQWQRMLDLSGRLQSRHAEEKRKLREECTTLAQRLSVYEPGSIGIKQAPHQSLGANSARSVPSPGPTVPAPLVLGDTPSRSDRPAAHASNDIESLRQEVANLNSRNDILRFALQEAQRHNQFINVRSNELFQRSGQIDEVVQRALENGHRANKDPSPLRVPPALSDPRPPMQETADRHTNAPQTSGAVSSKDTRSTASSSITLESLVAHARAVSPGPAELGFHVKPSSSSPEELIAALGPVPAPIPSSGVPWAPLYGSFSYSDSKSKSSRAKQPRRQSAADIVKAWTVPPIHEDYNPRSNFQIGGFRPLHAAASSHTHTAHLNAQSTGEDSPPRSYHSSPGPARDGSSPSSNGSAGRISPPEQPDQSKGPPIMPGGAQQVFQRPGSALAMPPPPRPSLPASSGPMLATFYDQRAA